MRKQLWRRVRVRRLTGRVVRPARPEGRVVPPARPEGRVVPPARPDVRVVPRARPDVFLSHHHADKAVEQVAQALRRSGLEPWLDSWHLPAGVRWQPEVAEALAQCASCAVLVGPTDVGAWERQELEVALERDNHDPDFRVFLVLLPGAPDPFDAASLSPFLSTRTWVDLRGGVEDPDALSRLVNAVKGLPPGSNRMPGAAESVCPYRGLQTFDEAHAEFFFGREAEVQRVLEKLKASRFLAVIGGSGSGKSSLVRAGVLSALRTSAVPGLRESTVRVLVPGAQPLTTLAGHLVRLQPDAGMQRTVAELGRDPRSLHLAASLLLVDRPREEGLMWVVDQAEELFTLCRDEHERAQFLANLLYAATAPDGPTRVILTLRADFYARLAAYPDLAQAAAAHQFLVAPLEAESLRRVIEEPARRVSLTFDPGLVDTILDDVEHEPGALPLLEHALLELWNRRNGRRLTLEGYRASGGVDGALAQRADEIYEHFTPEQRDIARRTLLRLTEPGEGTEDTRRRAVLNEVTGADTVNNAGVAEVIGALVDARMLTTSVEPQTGRRLLDVSHEALIRAWPRLRAWIDEDRAGIRTHRRITEAAHDWDRLQQDPGALLRGARLAEAIEWRNRRPSELNELEVSFLAASEELTNREAEALESRRLKELQEARKLASTERRAKLLLRGVVAVLLVGTLIAVVAAVVALNQRGTAIREQREADRQTNLAVSRELAASSSSQLSVDPGLSVLLASEAFGHARTTEAEQALERAVADYHPFTVLSGHNGQVIDAALSDDGRWAMTAGADKTARLFDAATGRTLAIMRGDGRALEGPAFSPDGQLAVVGGEDGAARVWQVPSGRMVAVLRGHTARVRAPAFSHDGRLIVAASDDGTARVWRARTGRQLRVLKGHKGPVQSAAFSPTARNVVTAGSDGTARVWETATGRTVVVLRGHTDLLHTASFSRNGRLVVTASRDKTARVWSAATGELRAVLRGHGAPVVAAAFSPNAEYVVSSGEDGTARIWDAATRAEVRVLRGHMAPVEIAMFSGDGRSVLTAGEDRSARLWDTETGEQVAVLHGHKDAVLSAALNRDATRVLTQSRDGTARVWHTSPGEAVTVLRGHTDEVGSAAFSPDRRRVVTASFDTTARIWTASTGETLLVLRGHSAPVRSAAFSPDGGRVVTASEDGSARVWDATSGRTLLVLKGHEGKVKSAVFSSDGRRLLTAGADRTARIWDATSGRSLRVLRGHSEEVEAAVFGRHDRLVATASEDKTARLWRAATGKSIATLRGHKAQIEGIAFSGDGRRLVTASSDDTARIWDVATGRTVMVLQGHAGDLEFADFSRDNRFVVTASDDKTARVWEAATGRLIVIFRGHETDLESAAFSRDARFIVTASEDLTARIYRCELCVSVEGVLGLAHRRVRRALTPSERARFLHDRS